ncbi:fimbrial biogenesis chaperone [Anditalea andensis]|nr:fimbria/pilus periplasmic chaperone [Anditalea andensis]
MIVNLSFSFAQGDLMVYPKRVVFAGTGVISQDLTLANMGNDSIRYQISIINYKMTEDGQFIQLKDQDEKHQSAEKNLRIFPRAVHLGPKESQKVKVQVYRTHQLETGEYKSHLYFKALPKAQPDQADRKDNQSGISTKLEMAIGISIPVILEIGNPRVKASLSHISLDPQASTPQINFYIGREGNKSTYGDLKVIHKDLAGNEAQVASAKGVAVYSPLPQRYITMKLQDGRDYSSGELSVIYHAHEHVKETFAAISIKL